MLDHYASFYTHCGAQIFLLCYWLWLLHKLYLTTLNHCRSQIPFQLIFNFLCLLRWDLSLFLWKLLTLLLILITLLFDFLFCVILLSLGCIAPGYLFILILGFFDRFRSLFFSFLRWLWVHHWILFGFSYLFCRIIWSFDWILISLVSTCIQLVIRICLTFSNSLT